MSLFMLSLAGIPMTVGFLGKFYVLSAAIAEGYVGLVLIALVSTVVGAYAYLRVVTLLYLGAPAPDPVLNRLGLRLRIPLWVTSLAVIGLGVIPGPVVTLVQRAALELF